MKLTFSKQISDIKELSNLALEVRDVIGKNSIVLLSGDLAAGKTTFVSAFCRLFGLEFIQSPTYALHSRYANDKVTIDHFDLYRLTDEDEIQSSGFYDQLNVKSDYKFIEWPERVSQDAFPLGVPLYSLVFKVLSSDERYIELKEISTN